MKLKRVIATVLIAILFTSLFSPKVQTEAAAQTSAAATTKSKSTAKLDKAFTIKKGQSVTISGELSIKLTDFIIWDTGGFSCSFDVTPSGGKTEYIYLVYSEEDRAWGNIEFVGDYMIKQTKAVANKNATLIISKPEKRESSRMNGKEDQYYTTTDNEYFEDERFILFVPKGITLRQDTMIEINEIMDAVEAKTGWEFKRSPASEPVDAYGPSSSYGYDYNFYWYVDPEGKKVHIAVVEDFDGYGYVSCAYYNNMNYVYDEEWDHGSLSVNTVAHELTHVINYMNVPMASDSDTFTEGFANAIAFDVTSDLKEKYPEYFVNYLILSGVEQNPDGSPSKITKATAQELFEHNYRIDYEEMMQQRNYQIGGAVCKYITDTYGAEGYKKLLKQLNKKFTVRSLEDKWNDPSYKDPTIRQYSNALRAVFGKDFFKKFAVWFSRNKKGLIEIGQLNPYWTWDEELNKGVYTGGVWY